MPSRPVFPKRARRHQRLQAAWSTMRPIWPGLPDDVSPGGAKAAAETGWQGRLAVHPALPVLLPDPAICRQARTARNDLPRQRHQSVGDWAPCSASSKSGITAANIATFAGKLRDEEAKLLDYRNFAEVSLVPKMAQSPEHVIEFLEDLARRARPYRRARPGRTARLRQG